MRRNRYSIATMTDTILDLSRYERRRRWLGRFCAFCAMLAMGLALRAPHLTDWDSWDYTVRAILAYNSDLCLGRWWFLAFLRGAYLLAKDVLGVQPLEAYLALQVACGLAMASAVVVGMVWVRRLTRSELAEILFAAMLVLGPMFGAYSFAVMTEGLTLLLLAAALVSWDKAVAAGRGGMGWALAGGVAFGMMIDMREPGALLCAWPLVSCFVDRPAHRWRLLMAGIVGMAIGLGSGVWGAVSWEPQGWSGYVARIANWYSEMAEERILIGNSLACNLRSIVHSMSLAGALVTGASGLSLIWALVRRRRLFWLGMSLAPYMLSLVFNHDTPVNPRFVLPAVFLMAPVVAAAGQWLLVEKIGLSALRAALLVGAAGAAAMALQWIPIRESFIRFAEQQHGLSIGRC